MNPIIIFCKNAVETLSYFSGQLAQAFETWGYETIWMDFDMPDFGAWKLKQAVSGKDAVLLTFNFIGLSGEEELWEPDGAGAPLISLWEKLGIRCLNIMVDHPLYYEKALQHPVFGLRTFCVDRDHVSFMRRFYPGVPCEFLPLAGNLPCAGILGKAESFEAWCSRPYPLIFTANYVPVLRIKEQLAQLNPEYRDFYYEIIESFIQNPQQELATCIETYMRREIPDISEEDLCASMRTMPAVDLCVRTHFREKTIRILAEGGVQVHLFGKDWEQVTCKRKENLICSGRMVNSADCVRAAMQAQFSLNTMPWFKDGAHDRIFTAMLHGAVSLTDDSAYLREQFADLDTLVYYDLRRLEELPAQVHRLQREPQRLYEIACRAKAKAWQMHTWERRAEVLRSYL